MLRCLSSIVSPCFISLHSLPIKEVGKLIVYQVVISCNVYILLTQRGKYFLVLGVLFSLIANLYLCHSSLFLSDSIFQEVSSLLRLLSPELIPRPSGNSSWLWPGSACSETQMVSFPLRSQRSSLETLCQEAVYLRQKHRESESVLYLTHVCPCKQQNAAN